MTIEEMKQKAYNSIKGQLDTLFEKGGIPNIKGFKKVIADLQRRIRLIESQAVFANSLEEVDKANLAIANLQGQCQAYKERLTWVNNKIKELNK